MATTARLIRNPFNIPELRHRLSRFVTLKDALTCALTRFANLVNDLIARHGHHIRIIKNAKSLPQISALANAGVNKLRRLHIETAASTIQHVLAYEVIFRNSSSLESVNIFAETVLTDKQASLAHYIVVSALALSPVTTLQGPSKLTLLRIEKMCLMHDSLMAILQGCTKLSELQLISTDVVGNPSFFFRHAGVKTFASSLRRIFPAVPTTTTGPSLLSYFPELTTLITWNYHPSYVIQAADQIGDSLDSYSLTQPSPTDYLFSSSSLQKGKKKAS
ncbi:hypothetical protein BGW39_007712 [Mortierella sp. 14UC]|nr:hypothetical protein BGW39_007712 [Mortierella sp. 14UC]